MKRVSKSASKKVGPGFGKRTRRAFQACVVTDLAGRQAEAEPGAFGDKSNGNKTNLLL